MLFSIAPGDFRRLERYLPKGLLFSDGADPLWRAIDQLVRMILMQRLHPGQKVPMDEIAKNIHASRTPVREALRLLETEGLVSSLPNRGFIVRRIGLEETKQLFEARRCVELYSAQKAFENRSKGFLSELRALHRIYSRVLTGPADRRRLGMLVDKAFHLRIAEQSANPHLTAVLGNVFDRMILTRSMDGFPSSRMTDAVLEHEKIVSAFEGNSAKGALEALSRNIENGGAAIFAHLMSLEQFGVPA
jgi:DNA-binding GntR family transcriptional regulator